jgi:hypothetical protein
MPSSPEFMFDHPEESASMDVLTDVLNTLELKGWLSSRRELIPPWRYDFAASKDAVFHVINFGGAYLHIAGETEPLRVEDGDVLLFPTGHPHSLYDSPASPLTRSVQLDYDPQRSPRVINHEGEGTALLMLCGAFHFDYPHHFPLLHRLPTLIHISGSQGRMEQDFADIVQLIARESALERHGTAVHSGDPTLDRSTGSNIGGLDRRAARSADQHRARPDSSVARTPLDSSGIGGCGGAFTFRLLRPIYGAGGRAADDLPHPLADAQSRPFAEKRSQNRSNCRSARL